MGKYDDFIISGDRPWNMIGSGPIVAYWDNKVNDGKYKTSGQYYIHWVGKKPENIPLAEKWEDMGHGPHKHPYAEVVIHLGSDPDNPLDLGADVEFCLGPEMEKHILTESCAVFLPPDFIHGPWIIHEVRRPFISMTVEQAEDHAEKSFPEMVSPELRENLMFIDQGYDSPERVIKLAKKMQREW